MLKRQPLAYAIGIALAGNCAPLMHSAHAQDDDEPLFEEVIVTATKRETSIYDVPVAISAFTGENIEKQGITDLVDVGKFVPNLNVTTFSAGHTSSANPFIRGIGLQDHLITTDPGVGVYVDGVYLGRQVGQNWSLSNIERLEVLRGPQGTLYGRNSIGGAINIITRKPGADPGSRVAVQLGTRGRLNADFFSDVRLADNLAMSFSGAYKRRDGVGEFLNITTTDTEVGELKDISGRLALLWETSEDLSILLALDGNDGDNGLNPYDTIIDPLPASSLPGLGDGLAVTDADQADDRYDNNTGQANQVNTSNQAYGISLTAEYAINDSLDAKLVISDRHSEYKAGLDDDGALPDTLSFPELGEADQTSFELQLNGDYDTWDFVAGFYFFKEDGINDQNPTVFLGGPGTFTLTQDTESIALYGNVGYNVTEQFRIAGGLRYTEDDKGATIDINDSLIDTGAARDWDELSWDLSAVYEYSDRMTLYGSIASGYQSGQFPPRPFCLFGFLDFTQPGNVSQPNCFVANDNITATNYEVGLKGQPLDNLQLSVAAFYTDYSDLPYQVSTTQGAGFNTVNIIVDQESTGFEFEGVMAVTDQFFINASLGLINVDVDAPDAEAPLTPELTASISPEFIMDTANGGELTFRADYSYRDEMNGEPSDDPGRLTKLSSRSIVNFDISYSPPDGDWSVGLYGRNVADERYENARLNTGDYILAILSNDPSEFGLRFSSEFR